MKGIDFKKFVPHLIVIGVFAVLCAAYFSPELQGKKIFQSDIAQFKGMSKEIVDFRDAHGEEPLWTNSMFGGMPAYQISVKHPRMLLDSIDKVFKAGSSGGFGMMFLYLVCFYILMIALGIEPKLGALGALAFALSSYFLIIIEVGHTSKAHAIGYMPAVIAGFVMLFRNKQYLWGTIVTALFMGLELRANHPQITYYMLIALFCVGVFYLVEAIRNGTIGHLAKASGLFIAGTLVGLGMSASLLMTTMEYSTSSTRGPSELTEENSDVSTSGLDKDYATSWSYGVAESWTLLVPNFYGGGSGAIGDNKDAMKAVSSQNRRMIAQGVDRYWGNQPGTSGPVYVGAIVFLLGILGLWYVNGPLKWGLLAAGILTLMLSWGKNFMPLTDFFMDVVPGYNKFRAVSMILVVIELVLPLMAILGVHELIKRRKELASNMNGFYAVAGSVVLVLILMLVAPSLFTDFFKNGEEIALGKQLEQGGIQSTQVSGILNDVKAARSAIFKSDVTRSLMLVLVAFGLLWGFIKDKLNQTILIVGLFILIIGDLWTVDRRFLNEENFVSKRQVEKPYSPSAADKQILADPDPYFRVFNTTRRLDQDAATSYYHKSLGGYHGAKLGRYQELIDRQLSQNNLAVINMLNAKYVIQQSQEGALKAVRNPGALGNAWFVNSVQIVEDANSEMDALTDLATEAEAVMDKRFENQLSTKNWTVDDNSKIELEEYAPNYLKFNSTNAQAGFAVFSDIYYQPGWIASIDGQEVDHARVNYVLRGMEIPAGSHSIEFNFIPLTYQRGVMINHISAGILVLLLVVGLYFENKKPQGSAA